MVLLASEFDLSKYLRAEGYGERDKKFRIKAVAPEVFERDGKTENKLVLWFTNSNQGLPLNKTNLRTLKAAFGDDTTNWVGKVIVVFPTMADFRGKLTPGLRVRIPPPKQSEPKQPEVAPAAPQQPATSGNSAAATPVALAARQAAASGNGAAVAAAALVAAAAPLAVAVQAAADPELDPDSVKLIGDELDDEIPY